MRAEPPPQLLVTALAEQVQVDVAERRGERERVVHRHRAAAGVGHPQAVVRGRWRRVELRLEQARLGGTARPDRLPAGDEDVHALGLGSPGPHDPDAAVVVGPQQPVGLAVLAGQQQRDLARVGPPGVRGRGRQRRSSAGRPSRSSTRRMPPTGMAAQAGRFASS
ncbi:hypothetical protein BH20ACT9_BH20ACT9_07850 [soil metagenome]